MRRLSILLIILLASCARPSSVDLEPFIGGKEGVQASFADLREHVFDGGNDPFDVVIRIDNGGEAAISRDNIVVRLDGINPLAFGKTEDQLTRRPTDDVLANEQRADGVIKSPAQFLEFQGLNHLTTITGSKLQYPLRAHVCYTYATQAVSKFCVRRNILNPQEGPCNVDEPKPVHNSGAPIHVVNVKETARGADKVGISFDIKHVGSGKPYAKGSGCPDLEKQRNRVFVRIDTAMKGLECTGLSRAGDFVEGTVQLFDGVKTVTCTQAVPKGDFEQPFDVSVNYDYETFAQTTLVVKHAGDRTGQVTLQAE
ncbi:hypothetical protein CMO91_00545 [Candidatus Woesearchaeota archaeon]|nr:hypothetical protein [Candidatus Woesearchaeota archaeon]